MSIAINDSFKMGNASSYLDSRMYLTTEQIESLDIDQNIYPHHFLVQNSDDGTLWIYEKGKGFHILEGSDGFENYDEETIESWFDLTPEEAEQIYNIINDSAISLHYLWSSSKINEEIVASLQDAKLYSEELIGKLANIELEVVSSLPDEGEKNKIYILIGVEKNVLYVWKESESTYINVGDFEPNLEGYLKTEDFGKELDNYIETDPIDFATI